MLLGSCVAGVGCASPGHRKHRMRTILIKPVDALDLEFRTCPLCGQSSDLQSSHIIPHFVFQWLRDSSATGHIRFSEAPNVRVQDGLKPRMLCGDCEQKFATWEKNFAEKCFVPILNGTADRIRYRSWMLKFATSVSWRVLQVFNATGRLADFPPHLVSFANAALHEWGEFLLDRRPHPGRHEQHLLLVDAIESTTVADTPANINRYLLRAIDMDVACTSSSVITYAKMGRFVLFGFIEMPHPRRWKGTKLNANEGVFGVMNIELPDDVGTFIMGRAQSTAAMYAGISDRQRDHIGETYRRDLQRAADSESLRAMHHDVLLFGQEAFETTRNRKT